MSPVEERLWYHLRAKRFHGVKFRRQVPYGPYVADFACPAHDLIIELDGDTHVGREDYDAARTKFLESRGYRVIRFANGDVMGNLEWVLGAIAAAVGAAPSP